MKKKIYATIGFILISFILFSLLFIQQKKPDEVLSDLAVINTIPKNNAVFVDNRQEIEITLNREISNKEGENLKLEISPKIELNTAYVGNKIKSSHSNLFEYGKDYFVKVIYQNKEIYAFSFSVNPFTPEQLEREGRLQAEGDMDYNNAVKKLIEKYPWYTNLPIETEDYRIVYDWELNKFRIRILKSNLDKNNKDLLINEAVLKLEKAGALKPIQYYVLESN